MRSRGSRRRANMRLRSHLGVRKGIDLVDLFDPFEFIPYFGPGTDRSIWLSVYQPRQTIKILLSTQRTLKTTCSFASSTHEILLQVSGAVVQPTNLAKRPPYQLSNQIKSRMTTQRRIMPLRRIRMSQIPLPLRLQRRWNKWQDYRRCDDRSRYC